MCLKRHGVVCGCELRERGRDRIAGTACGDGRDEVEDRVTGDQAQQFAADVPGRSENDGAGHEAAPCSAAAM